MHDHTDSSHFAHKQINIFSKNGHVYRSADSHIAARRSYLTLNITKQYHSSKLFKHHLGDDAPDGDAERIDILIWL